MDAGLAQLGVGVGREPLVAGRRRLGQQLLGDLARPRQVGAQEGDVPQAAQDALEIARERLGVAKCQRAPVGGLDVAGGIALRCHQRDAHRQQHFDLLAATLFGGQPGHERECVLHELDAFLVRAARERARSRHRQIADAPPEIAGGLEAHRQLDGDRRALRAESLLLAQSDLLVPVGAPARRHAFVGALPVQRMEKAESRRHRAVGPCHGQAHPQEATLLRQAKAAVLGLGDIGAQRGGNRRGGEIGAGDGGGLDQAAVGLAESLDLLVDKVAQVVGQAIPELGDASRQHPIATVLARRPRRIRSSTIATVNNALPSVRRKTNAASSGKATRLDAPRRRPR